MSDKKVKFIRVKGRVIPIRNQKKKEAAEGAALLSSGTALSVGGAAISGTLLNRARKLRNLGTIGSANMMASDSTRLRLKDFRLKRTLDGRVVGLGGQFRSHGNQLDLFDNLSRGASKSFEKAARYKAYKSAFRARSIFRNANILSSALVGLGVERFLSASGLEDKNHIGGDIASQASGVAASFFTHGVASSIENKIARGQSIRSGLKSSLKSLGKLVLKRRF